MARSLIRNSNFALLWAGHLISHAGDAVYAIALPWLMLELTGSKTQTALVSMSAYLPAIIFGLLAGSIVDLYNRKWIMIWSDIIRSVLVIVVPISLIYGFVSPLLIGVITFSLSAFSTFFYPARDSLIPHIVTQEELPAANSAISVSGQMSHLLGPLFAGVGISILGLTHLFTADAVSFLFSVLMISLVKAPSQKPHPHHQVSQWEGIKKGLSFVHEQRGLRRLLLLTFVNNIFIMGPAIIGLPVFVKEVLRADFTVLAQLEAAMAGGMIAGSFIFWKAIKKWNPVKILLFGIVLDGITYSFLYLVENSLAGILVLFIHGIGIPLITVSRTTIIQRSVPDHFRGRIFSMVYMAVMGTTALSVGLTGLTLEYITANVLYLIIGVGAAGTVFIGIHRDILTYLAKKSDQF
ncbi:MAG: MFS transporter [Candidatus Marinimicrobia bacterium]|nr:MFS transporter [Candidatus Neomarinimicrobiota bacterium]MDP6852474.1 MFS transporter [Candidatus Neomarinimicrobiota bacterium]MDP6936562.1 MFS transporter [Candidatus Neomarinimicrobiota bacterium]